MRALVIGASGLVGGALMRALGADATGTYLTRNRPGLVHLDARDADAVRRLLAETQPEVVFVPASEPNVDWCETHPEEARERNLGPVRAVLAAARDRRILSLSSDYVFDGERGPYEEDAERRPLSVYGQIKVELEDLLVAAGQTVVRTTTVFGYEPEPPKNFVLRLIASLRRGEQARIPSDQLSNPTYADDLATACVRIAGAAGGIWHVAGPESMPRAELALRVCRVFGLSEDLIVPTGTPELHQPAARPPNGGLISARYSALFGPPVRAVDEALISLRATVARI